MLLAIGRVGSGGRRLERRFPDEHRCRYCAQMSRVRWPPFRREGPGFASSTSIDSPFLSTPIWRECRCTLGHRTVGSRKAPARPSSPPYCRSPLSEPRRPPSRVRISVVRLGLPPGRRIILASKIVARGLRREDLSKRKGRRRSGRTHPLEKVYIEFN